RVLPRAEDRLRRQDARAVPRAAPHRSRAAHARRRGALEVSGAFPLRRVEHATRDARSVRGGRARGTDGGHDRHPGSARAGLRAVGAALRRLCAERGGDEAAVRDAVAEVERARTEVRLVHPVTHLTTRELLTEDQRRIYHEARWGVIAPAR